uniref:Uncharacterized protein n=1 Tax=Rhizophora mucronata TaxID=61149 RepID=A0A2P2QXE1_RHIMU
MVVRWYIYSQTHVHESISHLY